MPRLVDLPIYDLTPEIAKLPLHSGYSVLPERGDEEYITYHYSAVVYPDRSRAIELRNILAEARYQIGHNYAKEGAPPAYPDGLLYDFCVLSDGLKVRTRRRRQQLWHAGNATANTKSWSVHTPLGGSQNLTDVQRASLFELFDALRLESPTPIPRQNIIAHCEWPRKDGLPVRSMTYRLLPEQSECPGRTLFPHVAAYRSLHDAPDRYRACERIPVYEVQWIEPKRVALSGAAYIAAGQEIALDQTYLNGMGHLVGGLGFVELAKLERI